MTPQAYVATHPVTLALKQLGVTEDQLSQLTFRHNNTDMPFEHWSHRIPEEIPFEAAKLLKAYCTIKWLTIENPPASDQKRHAYEYLAMIENASDIEIGQKIRTSQSERAKKVRGKIGDANVTVGEIVKSLCAKPEHRETTASQLWSHFIAELDKQGLEPKEQLAGRVQKSRCEYDFKDRRKSISYGQFANLVSKARTS